ncbi:MAG TPA: hypothetical protein VGI40_00225 [Pirellulaceae bacterium]|jgi:hypothetical protein
MSEQFDPLETELAALKPRQPSHRLRQSIAGQLQNAPTKTLPPLFTSTWVWAAERARAYLATGIASAAGIAACALAAFVLRPTGRPNIVESPTEVPEPLIATAFDDSLPSVWAYQRALLRSPDDLDALLDKHASHASPTEPTPTHLFIHSDRGLLLKGDL